MTAAICQPNATLAGDRELWFYPTIGAAIAAERPWLTFHCPGCRVIGQVDLRTVGRGSVAS